MDDRANRDYLEGMAMVKRHQFKPSEAYYDKRFVDIMNARVEGICKRPLPALVIAAIHGHIEIMQQIVNECPEVTRLFVMQQTWPYVCPGFRERLPHDTLMLGFVVMSGNMKAVMWALDRVPMIGWRTGRIARALPSRDIFDHLRHMLESGKKQCATQIESESTDIVSFRVLAKDQLPIASSLAGYQHV